jgi:hypothetical protein
MAAEGKPERESAESRADDPWQLDEESRRRQLREDARRPLAVNLAEGLALGEFLATFTGSVREELFSNPIRLRELFLASEASQGPGDKGE